MRAALCVLCLLVSQHSWAAAVVISDVKAEFGDVHPGWTVSGEYSERLSWGIPYTSMGKSYLEWTDSVTSPQSVADWEIFEVGSVEHGNNLALASPLFWTDLTWSIDVEIDGTLFDDITFNYSIGHWDSWDVDDENARVWVGDDPKWEIMYLNGEDYLLKVYGFKVEGAMVSDWFTAEESTTTATLLASVSRVVIPEPQTYLMLGGLLLFCAVVARKRKTAESCAGN